MTASTLDSERPANVTVKLAASDRKRIQSLAISKKRTPHYLMKEAIQAYLDREEIEQRFIAAAEESWDEFEKTGLHITLDEMRVWAKELKTNPNAVLPACHT